MKKTAVAAALLAVFGLTACNQQTTQETTVAVLETDEQKRAYSQGAYLGQFMQQRLQEQVDLGIELDKDLLVQGFADVVMEKSQLDIAEVNQIVQALETDITAQKQAKADAAAQDNLAIGKEYLAKNAEREGITVTESGLQYEILEAGDGPMPTAEDTVKVHYRGTLIDGTEFDSSYTRGEPAVFPLRRVISGWTEGVQLMKVGAKYKFHIPSELAYGNRATGKITPNSTLVFDVELLSIESQ